MGIKACKEVERNFTWKLNAEKTRNVYSRLIKQHQESHS